MGQILCFDCPIHQQNRAFKFEGFARSLLHINYGSGTNPRCRCPSPVLSQVIDLTDAEAGTPSQPARNPSSIHIFGVPAFSQTQSSLSGLSRTPESNTSGSTIASKRSETRISPPLQSTSINKVTALDTLKRIYSPPASPTRVAVPAPDRVVP